MSLAFNLCSFPKNLSYVSSLQPGSSLPKRPGVDTWI